MTASSSHARRRQAKLEGGGIVEVRFYPRGTVWWCWFRDLQGDRISESTHQRDQRLAEEAARGIARRFFSAPPPCDAFDEQFATYLANCERKNRSGATLDFYVNKSKPLAALWKALNENRRDYLDAWCYEGPRESELYSLRPEDVRLDLGDHGMLHVNGTKTDGSDRWVPISEEVRPMFERRVATTSPGTLMFPPWDNNRRDLAAACERISIAKVSCNDFRRTYATWLGEAGVPEAVTASLLGHASTAMVRRVYTKIGTDAQKRAVATLPSIPSLHIARAAVAAGVAEPIRNSGSGGCSGLGKSKSSSQVTVPRDGVEPPTRGFSVPTIGAGA